MSFLQKITKNSSTASAVRNAVWLIGEKIISMLLVLTMSILVARHLGPEDFGLLNYILALIALLVPLSSLGLNAIVTRELVQSQGRQVEIMSTALIFRLLAACLSAGVLWIVTSLGVFSKLEGLHWALILLSLVNITTAFYIIDFWFQAKVESRYIVKTRFCAIVFSSLLKGTLVYLDANLSAFVWAVGAETLLIGILFFLIYYYRGGRISIITVNWSYGFSLLGQAKWLILSGIASIIYLKIDQLMLAEMVSTTEVGIYSVASRMSEVWYFFPTAIVASFFPALLKQKEQNNKAYQNRLQQLCDYLFIAAVAVAIPVSILSDWLIVFLFGEAYQAAGVILALHIWAGLFVFMRALLSKWLLAEHLLIFSFATHGIGAVINVVLNWLLIPKMQGLGAAIATVVSYAFASYIVLFFHHSTRPMAMIMTKSLFIASRLPRLRVKSSS